MNNPPTSHSGTLRPEIFIVDDGSDSMGLRVTVRVEWKNEARETVWTEECTPKDGNGFASKIVCDGEFRVDPLLYFVDSSGHRHFVLDAEPGELGAKLG